MYNGIGLKTVRGSGTNGYIQRNLAHISRPRQEFIVGLKTQKNKRKVPKPNKLRVDKAIIEHNKLRQIELLIFEQQIKYENEGKSKEEIKKMTDEYRERLMNQYQNGNDPTSKHSKKLDDTHHRTAQKMTKNAMMREALGLRENADGDIEDEREERRLERRKERELELTKEEKIRYEMDKLNKHPLDHSFPHRNTKRQRVQRKRKRSDVSANEESDESSSISSDSSYDKSKRRKRDKHRDRDRDRRRSRRGGSRSRSRDKSRSVDRGRGRYRDRDRDIDRGRWGDDRKRSRSRSKSKSRSRSRSTDRVHKRKNVSTNEIVPDF